MKSKLITHHSDNLDRDMDVRVYGTAGQTVVAFPTQGMTSSNLEDNGMVDALADYLESGAIQLFCVGSVDDESWAAYDVDPAERAARQEDYYNYVCDEVIPLVRKEAGADARPLTLGCDLGAAHAAVFALRRPDLFQGCMSLSGVYDSGRFFGDWMDDTLYGNVPCAFLPNMDVDHPYVEVYRLRQFLFCTGQSSSEDDCVRTTRALGEAFARLDVDVWCDYWGYDVTHEWSWWNKQIRYFLPIVLEDVEKTRALEGPAPKKAPAKKAPAKKAPAKKPAAKKAEPKKAEPKPAVEKEPAPAKKAPAKKAPAAKKDDPAEAPAAPAKAEKPAVPAKAEKPATPAKAEKPAVPAKAEKPAAPAKAEKPAAPVKAEKPAAKAAPKPKAEPATPAAKPGAAKPKAAAKKAEPKAAAEPKPAAKKAEPKPAAKPAAAKPAAAKPAAEPKPAAKKAEPKPAAKPAATKKATPKSNA